MKKIVFGGFCMISGIVGFFLFYMSGISLFHGNNIPDIIVGLAFIAFSIYGFVVSLNGLKKSDSGDAKE